jgi:ABC-type multidrug transport system fused ATPase/permease subunit
MKRVALVICLVGVAQWFFAYVYYAFWQHLAQNVSFDLRSRYLHAILRQEVAYFEKENVEQLPSQIGENFSIITEAIGEKYSNIIFSIATMISGIAIAFYRGADYAGACTAFVPVLVILMGVFGVQVKKATIAKIGVVKKMSGAVEESLSAIRLIASFANEEKEEKKFMNLSSKVLEIAQKSQFWSAMMIGAFKMFIFGYFCYAFYIATFFIQNKVGNPSNHYKPYNTGELLSVLISFNMGMMMLFGLTPNMQAMIKAKVVGH